MYIMKLVSLFLIFSVVTSCNLKIKEKGAQDKSSDIGAEENDNHQAKNLPASIQSKNLGEYLQVSIDPTNKPERYMIYFSWPNLEDNKNIRIRSEQFSLNVDHTQNNFSHEVNHNQKLTYYFEVLDEKNNIQNAFSKTVSIPRDYVVREGQNQLTENTTLSVNRFFISDVPFYTNGFSLELNTQELNSDQGEITTFVENAKAANDRDGRSGGRISIHAQTASGLLSVVLRGENGGQGSKGDAYPTRAADGGAPGSGSVMCEPSGGRHSVDSIDKLILNPEMCLCEVRGRDGDNGANGAKGHKGYKAGNGGNSGSLKIEIKKVLNFELKTDRVIGVKGEPGDGGDGQPGGIAQDSSSRCKGNKGHDGAPGPQGDRGDLGQDGTTEPICVLISSEGRNECF